MGAGKPGVARHQTNFDAKAEKGKEKYGPARRLAHTGGCRFQRCEIKFSGRPCQEKQSQGGGERSGFAHGQHEITSPSIVFIFVLIIHEQVRQNRHEFPGKQERHDIGGDQEQDNRSKEEVIVDAEAPQTVTAQILSHVSRRVDGHGQIDQSRHENEQGGETIHPENQGAEGREVPEAQLKWLSVEQSIPAGQKNHYSRSRGDPGENRRVPPAWCHSGDGCADAAKDEKQNEKAVRLKHLRYLPTPARLMAMTPMAFCLPSPKDHG